MRIRLIVFSGVPCSGKTTLARNLVHLINSSNLQFSQLCTYEHLENESSPILEDRYLLPDDPSNNLAIHVEYDKIISKDLNLYKGDNEVLEERESTNEPNHNRKLWKSLRQEILKCVEVFTINLRSFFSSNSMGGRNGNDDTYYNTSFMPKFRQELILIGDDLTQLSADSKLLRKLRHDFCHLVEHSLFVGLSSAMNITTLYILLDDNMYYPSMKRECLEMGLRLDCGLGNVECCFIQVSCQLQVVLDRNLRRRDPVSSISSVETSTILKMWSQLEQTSERNSIFNDNRASPNLDNTVHLQAWINAYTHCVSTTEKANSDKALADDVMKILNQPNTFSNLKTLAGKLEILQDISKSQLESKALDRSITANNIMHKVDLALRVSVKEQISHFKALGHKSVNECKNKSLRSKNDVLAILKRGRLVSTSLNEPEPSFPNLDQNSLLKIMIDNPNSNERDYFLFEINPIDRSFFKNKMPIISLDDLFTSLFNNYID
ncbi:unnamed protein product [Gordionus sp. m RMFG-2023]